MPGIDFDGKFEFLGLTVDGAADSDSDEAEEAGTPSDQKGLLGMSGFKVRYFWKVTDDLKADDYEVFYDYFNVNGDLILRDRLVLLPDEGIMRDTLAGGMGTVLKHEKDFPFPLEIVQEVRIRVRPVPKRKVAFPFLRMVSGETGVWIGLGR